MFKSDYPDIANDIRFGVEIECQLPPSKSPHILSWGLGRDLIRFALWCDLTPTYFDRYATGSAKWCVASDITISTENGRRGYEIKSPILQGRSGLKQLDRVLNVLKKLNCETDKSCSLHIHLSCAGHPLTEAEFRSFLKAAKKRMKEYKKLIGKERIDNAYCKKDFSFESDCPDSFLDASPNELRLAFSKENMYSKNRDAKINLLNLAKYSFPESWAQVFLQFFVDFFRFGVGQGTVEFRGAGGVDFTNIPATLNHVATVVNFFSLAIKDSSASFKQAGAIACKEISQHKKPKRQALPLFKSRVREKQPAAC